jgi:UDP-glucuronate 4-epimerase
MAPMLFARAILAGEPIKVFNQGEMRRDFTYIDDIAAGVIRCLDKPASADPEFDPFQPDPATAAVPHRLFNIGNSQPIPLLRFIEVLETALGRQAIRDLQPMQPGDVPATAADTSALEAWGRAVRGLVSAISRGLNRSWSSDGSGLLPAPL